MPRRPRGEKRPTDALSNAVHVMRIATGRLRMLPAWHSSGQTAAHKKST